MQYMKKQQYKCILIFLVLFFFKTIISAAGLSVYSKVSKARIGVGEDTTLKLTIAGAGFLPVPDLPLIQGFTIHQSGQYTGTDFSTGRAIPYTVFEYILTSQGLGNKTIPAIAIPYKGYYYSSNPIKIQVSDTVYEKEKRMSSFEQSVLKAKQTKQYRRFSWNIDKPFFVTSSISKTKLFFNEQLIYTITLFTKIPILKAPQLVFPEYESFHQELLSYKKKYFADINGQIYQAVEYKTALFPFMTGEHVVESVGIRFTKEHFSDQGLEELRDKFKKRNSFIENGRTFKTTISSIPLKNKPLSFSGLIGTFDIEATIDKKEASIDKYFILTIKIKGQGNLRSIPDVSAPIMDKLSEYDNQRFLNFTKRKSVLAGEKIYRIILVPREIGQETIPAISFSYYDIKEKDFKIKWTQPLTVTITEKQKEVEEKEETENKKRNPFKYYIVAGIIGILSIVILYKFKKFKK